MSLPLPKNDFRRVIVTTMKDEAPYMLNWIAYHLAVGFSHFVILTNDCSDGTEKIARKLEKIGLVTHKNNKAPHPKGPQKTGYQRMRNLDAVREADWLLAFDVDEYLRIDIGDGTLDGLFSFVGPEVKAMSFVWQLFGNNNVEAISGAPVYEEFTHSQQVLQSRPYECTSIKTLYQRKYYERIGTHRPLDFVDENQADFLWIDADGVPMKPYHRRRHWRAYENGIGYGTILGRINHYALRSLDGFMVKWRRGFVHASAPTVRGKGTAIDYWEMFNWNGHLSRPLRLLEETKSYEAALLAVENLEKLSEQGLTWHQERARVLKEKNPEIVAALKARTCSRVDQKFTDFSMHGSPPNLSQLFIPKVQLLNKALRFGRFDHQCYFDQYGEPPQS